jgi:thymidylate synthase (FAD)
MISEEQLIEIPKLRIVAPSAELLTPKYWFEDMGLLIEVCGRKSWKSEGAIKEGSDDKFIRKVAYKKGHESITEHCSITISFIGSRAMSHQLVRHRIAAYTQESQRFVDYSKEKKFANAMAVIVPPSIATITHTDGLDITIFRSFEDGYLYFKRGDESPRPFTSVGDNGVQWIFYNSLLVSYESYLKLRDAGIPSEDARFVLPNASKTDIATTYNIRQWRHVFSLRCTKHAQWEIRMIMRQALKMFMELLPCCFDDLGHLLED